MREVELLLQQLRARFGDVGAVRRCGGSQGAVWRVEVEGGAVAVKVAGRREREALLRLQGLRPDVPEVLVELDGGLVLSWIEGRPASNEEDVHERAGALLRRIHAVPVIDDDPISIPDALAVRVERWSARARGIVPDAVVARVGALVEPSAFVGVRRVQCHRDFTARNWIVRDDGSVAAIDFGQARLDLPQWDLVKLAADVWARAPRLRACFLAGYGGEDDPRMGQLVALHGLQTAVWGIEHGDAEFVALGRSILGW
jgi:Ser/Thr protein kinase RdoA (MazF antagonist)